MALGAGAVVWTTTATAPAQVKPTASPVGEWRSYGGNTASHRYSPLDQINAGNFNSLEVAWRFKTDSLGPRPEFNLQSTPLMVGGMVYSTAGTRRAVVGARCRHGRIALESSAG